MSRQARQRGVSSLGIEVMRPRIVDPFAARLGDGEAPLLSAHPAPVVDELVAGHTDEPGHAELRRVLPAVGGDGRHERLSAQVLGECRAPAAWEEVSIDLWQGAPVNRHHGVVCGGLVTTVHTRSSLGAPIIRTWPPSRPLLTGSRKAAYGLPRSHSAA
jgi:hypothetical protein